LLSGEVPDEVGQGRDRDDLDRFDQRRLGGINRRHERPPQPVFLRHANHRQHSGRVAQRAVEREFANHERVAQVGHNLAGGQQDAECDG